MRSNIHIVHVYVSCLSSHTCGSAVDSVSLTFCESGSVSKKRLSAKKKKHNKNWEPPRLVLSMAWHLVRGNLFVTKGSISNITA